MACACMAANGTGLLVFTDAARSSRMHSDVYMLSTQIQPNAAKL